MRLIITGYGRHGKDTVCEILKKNYRLEFTSSSMFVAERAVKPWMEARGFKYQSIDEMYMDRHSYRSYWYDAIADYCKDDPARLGRELFEAGNDIYCGLRNIREFNALKGIVDCTAWVDASRRLPPEDTSSITIRPEDTEYTIDNNGDLIDLQEQVDWFMIHVKGRIRP